MRKPATLELPNDLAKCQQMICQMHEQMQYMQHQLDRLLHAKFGQKAESLVPGQLLLFQQSSVEGSVQVQGDAPEQASGKRNSHGRRKPAKELPRRRQVHDVPMEQRYCKCCNQELAVIGEEVSEQYDYSPASIVVIEHVRLKRACKKCSENVVIAPKPATPIERGLAAPGMLAYVATSKFADHLPLYRLESIFKRDGAQIVRSTMCDWLAATAQLLSPLYMLMKAEVLRSQIIWTDDTPVKMQDRSHDKNIREARVWVYIGDRLHSFTVFDFTESRKRDGPKTFLDEFVGFLQADAFAGYDCIYAGGQVTEVACHAHARRKFFEALETNKFLCSVALNIIRHLYLLEKKAAQMSPEDRMVLRLEKAKPALRAYKTWLDWQKVRALPKSPFGKAVTYALNNWDALCIYVQNPELTIDNNRSERALRAVAIGRKNWLFAGSREGGRTAAVLSTVIASCKQHNINPQQYLKDVIGRICSGDASDLRALLPDRWTAPQT